MHYLSTLFHFLSFHLSNAVTLVIIFLYYLNANLCCDYVIIANLMLFGARVCNLLLHAANTSDVIKTVFVTSSSSNSYPHTCRYRNRQLSRSSTPIKSTCCQTSRPTQFPSSFFLFYFFIFIL